MVTRNLMNDKISIPLDELREICTSSLIKTGVSIKYAEIVADTLLEADLRGVTSHGIKNLPVYINRIQNGGINVNSEPEIKRISHNIYLIDGKGGLGQVAAYAGVEILRKSADDNNIAVVGVKNTNHCGMLAYYTKRISSDKNIGFMCSNTNPNIAAYGGAEPVLGTNPFSIAVPYNESNIILDMATSSVAKGKIYEHDMKNEPIPTGWALDSEGNITTNPKDAINGVLLPFGGHKGYSLALMIEILSGVLTGSGFSKEVYSLHKDIDRIQNVGFLMAVIPIEPFIKLDKFMNRLVSMVKIIKNGKKQKNVKEVFLPGEIEERTYQRKLKEGISVEKELLQQIKLLKG